MFSWLPFRNQDCCDRSPAAPNPEMALTYSEKATPTLTHSVCCYFAAVGWLNDIIVCNLLEELWGPDYLHRAPRTPPGHARIVRAYLTGTHRSLRRKIRREVCSLGPSPMAKEQVGGTTVSMVFWDILKAWEVLTQAPARHSSGPWARSYDSSSQNKRFIKYNSQWNH